MCDGGLARVSRDPDRRTKRRQGERWRGITQGNIEIERERGLGREGEGDRNNAWREWIGK